MKLKFEPFETNGSVRGIRSYYVYVANDDGTESKLVGIVTGYGEGRKITDWTGDRSHADGKGNRYRTRGQAAHRLLNEHRDRLSKRYRGQHRAPEQTSANGRHQAPEQGPRPVRVWRPGPSATIHAMAAATMHENRR